MFGLQGEALDLNIKRLLKLGAGISGN